MGNIPSHGMTITIKSNFVFDPTSIQNNEDIEVAKKESDYSIIIKNPAINSFDELIKNLHSQIVKNENSNP
jgi:hypothetical protein